MRNEGISDPIAKQVSSSHELKTTHVLEVDFLLPSVVCAGAITPLSFNCGPGACN